MMEQECKYGRWYWGVKVTKDVCKDGLIYVTADEVTCVDGVLVFAYQSATSYRIVNLMVPSGKWSMVFAASVVDGSPVAMK